MINILIRKLVPVRPFYTVCSVNVIICLILSVYLGLKVITILQYCIMNDWLIETLLNPEQKADFKKQITLVISKPSFYIFKKISINLIDILLQICREQPRHGGRQQRHHEGQQPRSTFLRFYQHQTGKFIVILIKLID